MADLDDFVRELVTEQLRRNRASAPATQRAQMQADVSAKANEFVNHRVIESMDRLALDRLKSLVDGGAPVAEVQRFIELNVPNKDYIAAQALMEFRNLYLGDSTEQPSLYVVQEGDTLSLIAAKYGTTYEHLAAINGIANPDLIYVGQSLSVG